MRIDCPSCAATYEVPERRLKPGKAVRCARCGSDWVPELETEEANDPRETAEPPPPEVSVPSAASLPEVTAMDRLAAARPVAPRPRGLVAAWIMTGIVMASTVAAVVEWRETIVRVWPPSGRILGGPVQPVRPPAGTEGKKPAAPEGKEAD